ncbi:hypothetical protein KC315_g18533, partial [Hortaea werneckii]
SHRSGDGGRATGLVQSFQLKNGPKGGRLTLKPETTTGLFKHGRASAQVAGRGGGLPDLAFNEMRFLQKPKDHQDVVSGNQAARGPAKKDRKHAQDEEISAYFAAHQHDPDGKQHDPSRVGNKRGRRNSSPTRTQQPSQPPVELPEKPFLGFGSKGTQQDRRRKRDQSTSYYSWSESAAPPRAEKGNAPISNAAFATGKSEEAESATHPNTVMTKSIFDSLIGLAAVGEDDKENKQLISSSPTGKLLKRARDAYANAGVNVEDMQDSSGLAPKYRPIDFGGLHLAERRPQSSRRDDAASGQRGQRDQRLSQGQRIWHGPPRQQNRVLDHLTAQPSYGIQNMSSDAEMLDIGNDNFPLELDDRDFYADAENNDEIGQHWQYEHSTDLLEMREQSAVPASRLSGKQTHPDAGRTRAIRGLSIELENGTAHPPILGGTAGSGSVEIDGGLAGFWKPNRLY